MNVFMSGLMITTAISFAACGSKKKDEPENVPVDKTTQTEGLKSEEPSGNEVNLDGIKSELESIKETLNRNGTTSEADIKSLERRLDEILDPVKKMSNIDLSAVEELKKQISSIHEKIQGMGTSNTGVDEKLQAFVNKLSEFEANMNMRQTPFHRACVVSLNAADAEDPVRRNVMNAMAVMNTSKIARATEITQWDFDRASGLRTNDTYEGVVFSGTKSEFRDVDSSYTYYAYSRLPSISNYNNLSFRSFQLDGENKISGTSLDTIDKFLVHDQDNSYVTRDLFHVMDDQNPLKAINANRIESYSRLDCDRIATYMANVGSKALTDHVDRPVGVRNNHLGFDSFRKHLDDKLGGISVISDIITWLEQRFETADHKTFTDSQRIVVVQDSLLRSKVEDGRIDYDFLDLIDAPHLRFFAAVDSEIGKAKKSTDQDFDNAYEGKNDSLIRFVERHRKNIELSRNEKGYRDLEAVFINFVPEDTIPLPPEVRKRSHNLFHTPK